MEEQENRFKEVRSGPWAAGLDNILELVPPPEVLRNAAARDGAIHIDHLLSTEDMARAAQLEDALERTRSSEVLSAQLDDALTTIELAAIATECSYLELQPLARRLRELTVSVLWTPVARARFWQRGYHAADALAHTLGVFTGTEAAKLSIRRADLEFAFAFSTYYELRRDPVIAAWRQFVSGDEGENDDLRRCVSFLKNGAALSAEDEERYLAFASGAWQCMSLVTTAFSVPLPSVARRFAPLLRPWVQALRERGADWPRLIAESPVINRGAKPSERALLQEALAQFVSVVSEYVQRGNIARPPVIVANLGGSPEDSAALAHAIAHHGGTKRDTEDPQRSVAYAIGDKQYIHRFTARGEPSMMAMVSADAVILLVDAANGPTMETRQDNLLARTLGISRFIVALLNTDLVDGELADLVELEMQELLARQDSAVIRFQSGLDAAKNAAALTKMIETLATLSPPAAQADEEFLMPVERVLVTLDGGTAVRGRVERGTIRVGDSVDVMGIHPPSPATVEAIEVDGAAVDCAQGGALATVRVRHAGEIAAGQVLAAPGSIRPHTKFKAEVYILTKEEGGRHTPFFDGYRPQFYFRTADVAGTVRLDDGTIRLPKDIELIAPVVKKGARFKIARGDETIAGGEFTNILGEG